MSCTSFCLFFVIKLLLNLFSGEKIIVVGGMALDTNPRDMFVEFDVAENKWQKLPSMPTPRYATTVFLISDKLYVIGKCVTSAKGSRGLNCSLYTGLVGWLFDGLVD